MSRGPRDRPSAAEKKEGQGCTGPVDCGKAVPASSADLVNRPQDFPLGFRGDGRRCSVLNFNPILVPRTAGSALPLSSTGSCERRCRGSNLSSRDFVCKTECHSTSERGSRGEDETAVPCSTDPWSQPPNRTSLSTSIAGFTGYTPNLHSARGGAMSKGQPAESEKESRPDDVPMRPFQLPYLYQRVFFFFFAPTP